MLHQEQQKQQNNNETNSQQEWQLPDEVTSTAKYWPSTPLIRDRLALPLALGVCPFKQSQIKQIPVARCQSCKAFINKFCLFKDEKQFECSICGCLNISNSKFDKNSIQLTNLSYTCIAPNSIQLQQDAQYKNPLLVFALDISTAIFSQPTFFLYATHLIKDFLTEQYKKIERNPQQDIKIMIIAFDDNVHEFKFNQNGVEQLINNAVKFDHSISVKNQGHIAKLSQKYQDIIELIQYLQDLVKQSKELNKDYNGGSTALLNAITIALSVSHNQIGKLYCISSITQPLQQFNLSKFPVEKRGIFALNQTECLPYHLRNEVQTTQLSISFMFSTNKFINMMPYYILAKKTNGQVRSFLLNQKLQFFYELRFLLHGQFNQSKYNTICKIRHTSGLKIVGIFGNFRATKTQDQIQLLSCPSNRQYVLQFLVKGKINQPFVVIQFSFVYISKGKRWFKIINVCQKISDDIPRILHNIDYMNVGYAYLRAMAFNLDNHNRARTLQLVLQEKCKKHIFQVTNASLKGQNQVRESQQIIQKEQDLKNVQNKRKTLVQLVQESQLLINPLKASSQQESNQPLYSDRMSQKQQKQQQYFELNLLKKARPYTLMVFYLLRHAIFTISYQQSIAYDKTIQMRNKIATLSQSIKKIWPVLYAVSQEGYEIIQALKKQINGKATIALIADCGDRCFLLLKNARLRNQIQKLDSTKVIDQLINMNDSQLSEILVKIRSEKDTGYLPVYLLRNINQLILLDQQGPYGYANFVTNLTMIQEK